MSDESKSILSETENNNTQIDCSTENDLMTVDLNQQSLALINQIITESDEQKANDLTHLFNVNQNKKTMIRVNKLSELLDTITDQALTRFTVRPDEISNKELLDGLKIVQDLIERGQKQVSNNDSNVPLIQVNQQTNEVNLGDASTMLSRDSRERVKSTVLGILDSIIAYAQNPNEFSDSEIAEIPLTEDEKQEDIENVE